MTVTKENFDVDDILSQLTLKEKVSLLSLKDFWHTHPVERLGVPSIRVSDGPNGVRGTKFFKSQKAACFTCGSGLASTWNVDLLKKAGALMSLEARHKGAHSILGPTCNIQRGPLGGRGFESFSEDPFLSGLATSAIINGIQLGDDSIDGETGGISATVKHFVCNDLEDERNSIDVIVSERALREVYLLPFQLAVKNSNPKAFMSAYNKVNGTHVSQSKQILDDILRKEWGWDGLVMSDWFGVYSIEQSINAGLDLECPGGPALIRKYDSMLHQINAREIKMSVIDERVKNVLNFVKFGVESGIPSDGVEDELNNTPQTSAALRELAREAVVLLKNEGNLLPLKASANEKIAIIGPNAKNARIFGGGSASLNPYYTTDVYSGIASKFKEASVASLPEYALGSNIEKSLYDFGKFVTAKNGETGFLTKVYKEPVGTENRTLLDEFVNDSSRFFLFDYTPKGSEDSLFYMDMEAYFTPEVDGDYLIKESCLGTMQIFFEDELFIDDKNNQELGFAAIGASTKGHTKKVSLKAGQSYKFTVEFGSGKTFTLPSTDLTASNGGGSLSIGFILDQDEEQLVLDAVELAKSSDKVVVVVGTSPEFESEGFDRPQMDLPGNQEYLVEQILKVNKNVILVNLSGTPVTLPWIDEVPAFVQGWFNGCESGNAIADVLFGDFNPSGKLSLTFPKKVEDNPSFLTYKSNNGQCIYGEDVFVGYKYYEKIKSEPLFPFGFGLSYTTFESSNLTVALEGDDLVAEVDVKNTGDLEGQEIVQLYVTPSDTTKNVLRPNKELKAFAKVSLKSGESKKVKVTVPYKYAASYFNVELGKWHALAGNYGVLVGNSSDGEFLEGTFALKKAELWSGI